MARAAFHWQDPFLLEHQLTEDERMIRCAAADYCQDRLGARVTEAFRNGRRIRVRDLRTRMACGYRRRDR